MLVFESPRGALRDRPEAFPIPAPVTAPVMMPLDLAVGAGGQLWQIDGRDRRQSYREAVRDGCLTDPGGWVPRNRSLTVAAL